MARRLPSTLLPTQKLRLLPPLISFFVVLTAVISVFSVVMFLCGAHKGALKSSRSRGEKRTVRLGGKKKPVMEKMKSSLSSKALLMAKMISWRKVEDVGEAEEYCYREGEGEEEEEEGEDGVVWKKTIIKGEKCRPLDFSGRILYDNDGNLLPD
ncbi:UNVERIFIED_CONTAM: hypothetical protein Sradi_0763900 [Sesamum radiatum]|uniref:Transmembrane protein n=1 Tax=Sesamum radiatum TaxID=300843 RepID=A0AAW2VNP7_SESRA